MRHFFDSVDKVPQPKEERQDTQDTINGFQQTIKSETVISLKD